MREIDLRPFLRPVQIRVELAGGLRPRSSPIVLVGQPGELSLDGGHWVREGSVTLALPAQPIDLTVACEGWKPKTIRASDGPIDVRLEPWPVVRVSVQGWPALPENITGWLELRPIEPGAGASSVPRDVARRLGVPTWVADPAEGTAELPIGNEPRRVHIGLDFNDAMVIRTVELRAAPAIVEPGCRELRVQVSATEIAEAIAARQRGR